MSPGIKSKPFKPFGQLTIEETYELTDAITGEDWKGIKGGIG
jgi:NTP pyrophosphatase (non-canonical NTP hydrolase)